jgi:hypothetical protein
VEGGSAKAAYMHSFGCIRRVKRHGESLPRESARFSATRTSDRLTAQRVGGLSTAQAIVQSSSRSVSVSDDELEKSPEPLGSSFEPMTEVSEPGPDVSPPPEPESAETAELPMLPP